jgi:hypothetical protein
MINFSAKIGKNWQYIEGSHFILFLPIVSLRAFFRPLIQENKYRLG